MSILRYHGFNNWRINHLENEDLDQNFTFGFELEVTLNNMHNPISPTQLSNILSREFGNLFVYEHDSSIGEGVEIISQPMTWKWFEQNQNTFKKLLQLCIDNGFDSHKGNKCGLHVHIGRQALKGKDFDNNQLNYKSVMNNIHFILERFQNSLYKFSRRTQQSYHWTCPRTELVQTEFNSLFIDKEYIKNLSIQDSNHGQRYHSLNTTNDKTVEIRLLRGTLKWETFLISMNLIKNIIEFSRKGNNSVTFKQLVLNGLDDDMKQYALNYCDSRNINIESDEIIFLERTINYDVFFDKLALANSVLDED